MDKQIKSIEYTSKEKAEVVKFLSLLGKGIVNARSAEYLIKHSGFSGQEQLNEAIADAWRRKIFILQVGGKYFIARNSEELSKYITNQTDKDGNPVIEFR